MRRIDHLAWKRSALMRHDGSTTVGDARPRAAATRLAARGWLRRALREPLLHFFVLGGLIFLGDAVLHPPDRDARVIVVTKAQRQSMIDSFDEDKVRKPTAAELQGMIDHWVDGEVLYREGKALGVDRGDETIRDRIAFKLQLLIFNELDERLPTEAEVRAWFEQNRARFDEPERVSYYISPPMPQGEASAQLALIQDGREPPALAEKTHAIVGRSTASLRVSYGEGFRERLLALPAHAWSVIQSNEGWHVIRLDSFTPAVPARLEDVYDKATHTLQTEDSRRRASAAVDKLKTRYTVRFEDEP